jgi:hypothetical protein
MKTGLLLVLLLTMVCAGCVKEEKLTEHNCELIQHVVITGAKDQYFEGETIALGINEQPDIALYQWWRTNGNELSGTTELTIEFCEKKDEGWYYLAISYPDCTTKVDSVYISVKRNPSEAPCTLADNKINFSNIPAITASAVAWKLDGTYNRKKLSAYYQSGYPDFNIYFNSFWNNKEPEDGEYGVGNVISSSDSDPYVVQLTSLYSGILFQGYSGVVYITHENGKLRATFCSVGLRGSNGSSTFTTTAVGAIKAP